jgi:hypothetical protein
VGEDLITRELEHHSPSRYQDHPGRPVTESQPEAGWLCPGLDTQTLIRTYVASLAEIELLHTYSERLYWNP